MKKIFAIILTIVLSTSLIKFDSFSAASKGSISMTSSASTVYVGNTFTIKITATCSAGIGGVIGYLEYSSSYLTLKNTDANDDYNAQNGKLIFDSTSKSTKTYSFTFTVRKTGKTTVSFHINDFIDYENGDSVTGYATTVSKTITLSTKPAPVYTKSSNNALAELNVEGYDLSFSSDELEYSLILDEKLESLNITAKPSDSKAKVEEINSSLKEGYNDIVVTCTAEDGSKREYVIHVYVFETPTIYYQLDNEKLGVIKRVEDDILPNQGFKRDVIIVNDEEVVIFNKDKIDVLYLINENGDKKFYTYDRNANQLIDIYQPLFIGDKEYFTIRFDYADFEQLNDMFESCVINIDGQTFNGWRYKDNDLYEFKLVYLKNQNGNKELYRYDTINKTVLRYYSEVVPHDPTKEIVFGSLAIAGGMISIVLTIMFILERRKEK